MTDNVAQTDEPSGRRRLRAALAALAITAATIAAYANSFNGPFLFDDRSCIKDNMAIRRLWPVWDVIRSRPASRPIVNLSLAVNYAVSGPDVWSYHAFNLAVHVLGSITLFAVVRRTLLSDRLRDRFGRGATALALAIAAIWAVHPLQTTAVTYMIQRAESMMGLFYLLSLYCSIRCFSSSRPRLWYAPAILACAAGMGCKQVMVTAPLIILLYDRTFAAGSLKAAVTRRMGLYIGLAATWAILATSAATILHGRSAGMEVESMTPWTYALTQPGVIMRYLRLAFWPDPLILDYVWPAATTVAEAMPEALVIIALVAATAWGVIANRPAGFVGAWFLAILAPSSSILPIRDAIFEHRMYLPLAAVVTATMVGAYAAYSKLTPERKGFAYAAGFLVAAVAAAAAWGTARRNSTYASAITMWQDVLAKQPDNARAYNNLGVVLIEQGETESGIECYMKALQIHSGYAGAHRNLGAVLARQGKYDEALKHFRAAVNIRPDNHRFHCSLGKALAAMGRTDEAMDALGKSLDLAPNYPEANYQLASILIDRGKLDEAITHYRLAVEREPWRGGWQYNLANALRKAGRTDEAIGSYRKALAVEPDNALAHNNLALLLARQGRAREAIGHYRAALAARPGHLSAMSNLAWVLATDVDESIRNGPEAVRLAEQVCSATDYSHPGYLDTLAAAYAETGQFDKAGRIIHRAIELVSDKADTRALGKFRSRADLYGRNRPLRISR